MKTIKISLSLLVSFFLLASCNDNMSLEAFFVKKGQDKSYTAANLSSDVFLSGADLTPEEREKVASIKKINFLAFQKDTFQTKYESDRAQLKQILKDKKFRNLMNYSGEENEMKLVYTGNEKNIDELIVFAENKRSGFMLARLLGDDMTPEDFYNLVKIMDKLEFEQIEGFTKDLDLSGI